MSRWFRLYDELLDDPKVQLLPAEDFRGYINLLCLASKSGGRLPGVQDISYALRQQPNAIETLLERLRNGGLIASKNGGVNGSHYAINGWDKRQYKSDISTERVKRFRERQGTLFETPSDTESESESARADARVSPGREVKATQHKARFEFDGEETIMSEVRKELAANLSTYATDFCNPARPISFERQEGRLVALCCDGFTHSLVRDHELRLSKIAQRHGFTEAWIREKPKEIAA